MIQRRPILSFLILTFVLSYPLGIAFNFLVSSTLPQASPLQRFLPRLVTVFGPAVAALVVAAAGGGAIRPKELVRSYRIPARWIPWLVAIVLAPLAVSSTAFVLAGMTADHLPKAHVAASPAI